MDPRNAAALEVREGDVSAVLPYCHDGLREILGSSFQLLLVIFL